MSSAGFTTLLFCILMQGFALVLGRACGLSRYGTAEEKAFALLKQWLSPAQLAQYENNGHFEVRGCHTGKCYRIRRAHQMNIDELDEAGARSAAWCFGPEGIFPSETLCWRRRSHLRMTSRPPSQWRTADLSTRGRRASHDARAIQGARFRGAELPYVQWRLQIKRVSVETMLAGSASR